MRTALALVCVVLVGCELLVGIPSVSLDSTTPSDSGVDGPAAGGGECQKIVDGGPRPGPEMVLVSVLGAPTKYCIDTTEVTVAEFNAYLLETGGAHTAEAPPVCHDPRNLPPPPVNREAALANTPVSTIGICDAWSYCHWAGKRLCGALGDGGSVRNVEARLTEWGYACKNGQNNTNFPYGDAYDAGACTTEGSGLVAVGSKPDCHGAPGTPFAKIFDMSGNAQELENDIATIDDSISAHGGSWRSSGETVGCDSSGGFSGYIFNFDDVGFRCCADP